MTPITTFWRSKLMLLERRMLKHYGVAAEIADKADGSFLCHAFLKGWYSHQRRSKGDS